MEKKEEEAVMIGVKYPSDSRKSSMSRFLKVFRIDLSVMIIVPKAFVDQITTKITQGGGKFEIFKEQVTLVSDESVRCSLENERDELRKLREEKKVLLNEMETITDQLSNNDAKKGFTKNEWNTRFQNVNDFYKSLEWALVRIIVLHRNEYHCKNCNKNPSRQVHHLNDPRYFPEISLDLANLILLCDKCHDEWHQRGS